MMSYVVLRLAFLHNSASRPFKFAGLAPGHHDGKSSSSLLETASQVVSIPGLVLPVLMSMSDQNLSAPS